MEMPSKDKKNAASADENANVRPIGKTSHHEVVIPPQGKRREPIRITATYAMNTTPEEKEGQDTFVLKLFFGSGPITDRPGYNGTEKREDK